MSEVAVIQASSLEFNGDLPEVFDIIINDFEIGALEVWKARRAKEDFDRIIREAQRRGYRVTKQFMAQTFSTQYRFDSRPKTATTCELNPL